MGTHEGRVNPRKKYNAPVMSGDWDGALDSTTFDTPPDWEWLDSRRSLLNERECASLREFQVDQF